MDENKKKSSVWLYAVILFFSAFIVLLFAGYSQIRLNKNLENYKNQVFSTKSEKEMYQQHFASAQEMNEELNKKIEELGNEIDSLKNNVSKLERANTDMEADYMNKISSMKLLNTAMIFYLEDNAQGCIDLLDSMDQANLDKETSDTYDSLRKEAGERAGQKLFEEGYVLYSDGKYSEAVTTLTRSFEYAPDKEFSDKCLYYIAYSNYKIGNKSEAVARMKQLIEMFPESDYVSKAKKFIRTYDD